MIDTWVPEGLARVAEVLPQDGLVWTKGDGPEPCWWAFVRLEHTQGMRRRGQLATLRGCPVELTVRRSCVGIRSADEQPPALSVGDEISWRKAAPRG